MTYFIGETYWDLEPENHKFTPAEWHGKYKYECFCIFNFTCSDCDKHIKISEGVVHHLTYQHKGGIYQARPEEILNKICILCYECHNIVHSKKSIDGITKIIKYEPFENKYYRCFICGETSEDPEYMLQNNICESCYNVQIQTIEEYDNLTNQT